MMIMVVKVLADLPPNPGPSSAGLPNITALSTIFSWLIYGALALECMSAIIAGAALAIGHNSARPDLAVRGKTGLLWSMGGAAITALAVPLVIAFYGLFR